ncbi:MULTISPECIES: transporter substrate-binding domain-containing protein [Bacillaceae]|uniref:Cysteine ABC transporter substrate-binding protein n=1 Tax=Domibacillus aminovorans TaxID=29332 RepID=A0A177KNC3_9BACI|nr:MULTISPECIES: transporter substrate-binding domain-containing protein [Bacillaceae]OAH54644.1 cysteine ABC transporter substrate-binding protein [Domibacillus aminovorans]
MKKQSSFFTVFLLVTVFALVLSACSSGGNESSDGGEQAEKDLLQTIKDEGVMKVGVMGTYPPYNFLSEDKEMDGFDADIAKELAKRLGVEAEFVAQEFSGIIPGLQSKKFDVVVSQMTITEERKEQMDFTAPYIKNEVKVIVSKGNDSIKGVEDFVGKNIGVGLGTNDETFLRTELLPKVGEFNIKTYDDVVTSLKDLDAGRIDATINNIYALKPIVEINGFDIKAVGEAVKSDEAGVAIRKGNESFLEALDQALAEMKEDGTYNEIFKKWFGEEPSN